MTRAESAADSAARVSLIKMLYPGVSRRLILVFFHSATAMAVEIVILRWISSSSKSVIVLPSSTRVRRLVAPVVKSIPAVSVVLPESPWPTTPTFRMSLLSYTFTDLLQDLKRNGNTCGEDWNGPRTLAGGGAGRGGGVELPGLGP